MNYKLNIKSMINGILIVVFGKEKRNLINLSSRDIMYVVIYDGKND